MLPSKEITVQFRFRKAIIPILIGAILITVSLLYLFVLKKTPSPEKAVPEPRQVTFTGNVVRSEISPDGKFLAFVNLESFEEQVLWIKDPASGQANGYSGLLGCVDFARRPSVEKGVEKDAFSACSLSPNHSGC